METVFVGRRGSWQVDEYQIQAPIDAVVQLLERQPNCVFGSCQSNRGVCRTVHKRERNQAAVARDPLALAVWAKRHSERAAAIGDILLGIGEKLDIRLANGLREDLDLDL